VPKFYWWLGRSEGCLDLRGLDGTKTERMIVQIQRIVSGVSSDQVSIRNEDWSVYWVGTMPDGLRIWPGSRTMVFAEAHLTETGRDVDHAVAGPEMATVIPAKPDTNQRSRR
jgi:hypothetical protein